MKFTAVVLISATAVSAFKPSDQSCVRVTALHEHALGGWSPPGAFSQARTAPAVPAVPFDDFQRTAEISDPNPPFFNTATATAAAPKAASTPAFSGFGHASGPMGANSSPFNERKSSASSLHSFQNYKEVSPDPNPPFFNTATYQATAAAAAPKASAAPAFSGFGHASGPMGANSSPFNEGKPAVSSFQSYSENKAVSSDPNPPFFNTATVQKNAAAAAPQAAATPAFSGFGHASGPMGANSSPFNEAKPVTPVFTGFGHARELKDPNPPSFNTVGTAAAAPQAAATPAFSGFGHATGPMGGNSSPFNNAVAAAPVVTEPVFSGFGHAHSGQATSTRSYLEGL